VGKKTLKSNANEALSDDFLKQFLKALSGDYSKEVTSSKR
jgi:hypothetical protein